MFPSESGHEADQQENRTPSDQQHGNRAADLVDQALLGDADGCQGRDLADPLAVEQDVGDADPLAGGDRSLDRRWRLERDLEVLVACLLYTSDAADE